MRRFAALSLVVATSAVLILAFAAPQGVQIRWGVICGAVDHEAKDDPIVFPGQPGASHLHDFIGNETTDAFSTADSLRGQPSRCKETGDTAAYWAPAIYLDGSKTPTQASNVIAYYIAPRGTDFTKLKAPPAGLLIVAGDSGAQGPQPTSIVAWGCGKAQKVADPNTLNCTDPTKPLFAHVFFPDCWDGVNLDSADHKSHMAYSQGGVCDGAHPVPVVTLHLQLRYPVTGQHAITIATLNPPASRWTFHADFVNAWDQARLEQLVAQCINAGVDCGLDP